MPDAADRPMAELRQRLTVLFSDLSNSTTLAGRMEAEVFADLMSDLRAAFSEAVESRGGAVNQFQGDALQAVFGYPGATEHDCRLAVEAALDVHRQVRSLRERYAPHGAAQLAVHSGVHAGLVLVRPGVRGGSRLEISGSTPGVAKHLSDEADDDELLVSTEALGPASHLFETVEHRPARVKGLEQPLPVRRVLGTTALRTRFQAHVRRGLFPFVGREREIEQLNRALREARTGRCQFVLVRGAPGLGKTRLAEEFLRLAEIAGFGIARGDCDGGLRGEPLQPFVQMLRARWGVAPQLPGDVAARVVRHGLESIDPALAERLPELLRVLSLDGPDAATRDPERTTEALRDVFVAIARRQPQVLFLDDWQSSDDATRRVVHALRACPDLPLMLLAASRPPEVGEVALTAVDTIALGPLSEAEAARSIAGILPAADPFLVEEIGRRSGGNPLFVEELCHFAGRGEWRSPGALQGAPAWLETLIESRISRLPPEQYELLSAASIIGNAVPGTLLERLTGFGPDHPVVHELTRNDLLVPSEESGALRFKHGITREVVYAAIGLQRRREMHRQVAELLRAEAGPSSGAACETLAYHCAGSGDPAGAAHFAEQAGDKAMSASSIDRAKVHYRAALEMLDRLPADTERYRRWRSLIRRLGMACVYDPVSSELPLFDRAIEEARLRGDAAGGAYAAYWLAYLHYSLGDARRALRHGEHCLAVAEQLGDRLLVHEARLILGQALAAACRYDEALDRLAELRPPEVAARPGTPPGTLYALAVKGSVLGDLGRFDEAERCFDLALSTVPRKAHEVEASILCWRSAVALWQGRFDDAHRHARDALRVADQVRSLYLYAMARGMGGYAEWKLEPGIGALRQLVDGTSWLEQRGKELFVSLNYGWLTEALVASGRIGEARVQAARALNRARQGDALGAPMALRALARAEAQDGALSQARRHLARAVTLAQRRRSPHEAACNALCRAQVEAMAGQGPDARAAVHAAQADFDRLGMAWHGLQARRLAQTL